jgi:hypothetical protein
VIVLDSACYTEVNALNCNLPLLMAIGHAYLVRSSVDEALQWVRKQSLDGFANSAIWFSKVGCP